ncbi:cephalosporin hydroxylase [Pseudoalteromonas sp. J010]|uniref:cephalosporin hydroxylase family protein n=1 Tax=Pseudoalteromonas sp. J010 TaxID=998465 RepID=UPI000F64C397|nr:cephalosporin hydroxylase family protein [Pseudoalteromonas sp. J010]RRS09032.1 cephalosporin hydroxylase [Pseudoalteromonas sp. J010]
MNKSEEFQKEVAENIRQLQNADELEALSVEWIRQSAPYNWSYNFSWLGRPAIQFPNDVWALQEIIWSTKPDLIIETGVAHGGSVIASASLLALLDYTDAVAQKKQLDPLSPGRKVIGIDIDIRQHNRDAIESHPLAHKIELIQGSSVSSDVVQLVCEKAKDYNRVMVILDSNHTHDHVIQELQAYSPLVSETCYCIVYDTIIEAMPEDMFPNRPWGKGNNPYSAVKEFLKSTEDFEVDSEIHAKLQITVAPMGFLRRVKK